MPRQRGTSWCRMASTRRRARTRRRRLARSKSCTPGKSTAAARCVPLLRAVDRLSQRHPERPIHVTTTAHCRAAEWQRIREAGLEQFIEERPRIPFAALFADSAARARAARRGQRSHDLFGCPTRSTTTWPPAGPSSRSRRATPRCYELLADSGAGHCVEPADIDGIEQALEQILFSAAPLARTRIDRFHWSNLAQDYLQASTPPRDDDQRRAIRSSTGSLPRLIASSAPQASSRDTSSRTAPAGKSASAPSR